MAKATPAREPRVSCRRVLAVETMKTNLSFCDVGCEIVRRRRVALSPLAAYARSATLPATAACADGLLSDAHLLLLI